MSLDPHFASSAYGLIAIAEMGLLALSVSIFAAVIGEPPDDGTLAQPREAAAGAAYPVGIS